MLTIDLTAVVANYHKIKNHVGTSEVAAVVKANAYGLGMAKVAKALRAVGCECFFVATLDEGIALRQNLQSYNATHIVVLQGIEEVARINDFIAFNLIPVVNTKEQLHYWQQQAQKRHQKLPCFLHIDTGMNRLGFAEETWLKLCGQKVQSFEGLEICYVMSHLACADLEHHEMNQRQLEKFNNLRQKLPSQVRASLANSSGIFKGKNYHFDMIRPGIALYGGNPKPWTENPMKPVVSLTVRILQKQNIKSGSAVGYGAQFKASGSTCILTIGLGYADGFWRCLENQASVYIKGQALPVVGRVSMDLITVDASLYKGPEQDLEAGAFVEILGKHQKIDSLAKQAKTISYEVLTSLGLRHQRCYLGLESESKDNDHTNE